MPVLVGIASAIIGGIIGYLWRTPKVKRLTGELDTRNRAYGSLETEHRELGTRYTGMETEYSGLQATHRSLDANYTALRTSTDRERNEYKSTIADWESKYADLDTRFTTTSGELETERGRHQATQKEYEEYRNRMEGDLKSTTAKLNAATEESKTFRLGIADWEKRHGELTHRFTERDTAYGALQSQFTTTSSDLEAERNRASEAEKELAEYRAEAGQQLADSRASIQEWSSKYENLENKLAATEQAREEETARLRREIDQLTTEREAMATKNKNQQQAFSARYEELEGKLESTQQENEEETARLRREIDELTAEREAMVTKHSNQRQAFGARYQELEGKLESTQQENEEETARLRREIDELTLEQEALRTKFHKQRDSWRTRYETLEDKMEEKERDNEEEQARLRGEIDKMELEREDLAGQFKRISSSWDKRYSDLESTYQSERNRYQEYETNFRRDLDLARSESEGLRNEMAGMRSAAAISKLDPKLRAHMEGYQSRINWGRIGRYTSGSPDDLQKIKGVGPFLEEKLNALGIFTFRQISNFNEEDMDMVNEAIKFFPGRIKRDGWVRQAKDFIENGAPESGPVPYDRYASLFSNDDLQIIEGIGPKTEALLKKNKVTTWDQISEMSEASLQKILDAAGSRFKLLRPKTWPQQATYAMNGQWKELVEYQKFLDTGRENVGDFESPAKIEQRAMKLRG